MKTIIGVNGACGRMGQRIIQLAHEDKSLAIGAALEAEGHPCIGKDVGEVAGIGAIGVTVQPSVPVGHRLDVLTYLLRCFTECTGGGLHTGVVEKGERSCREKRASPSPQNE